MRAHLHSDGSAAFDDGMVPLRKPLPASRKLSSPDPKPGDPPQRDPGDEDPSATKASGNIGLIGRRTRLRVL